MGEAMGRDDIWGELQEGDRVGRYKVLSRLGSGAMGDLYLALDEGLGRKVALKLLAAKHREAPDLRMRFLREARACAAVNHPNVVQVFLVDEHEGRPYFAMEYLRGIDLGRLIRLMGPLRPGDAAAVAVQAALGLREAASKGVIHRDVKPANLFVTESGVVKVTDFGLAKTELAEPKLTATGMVVGTPDYIAPEQARGEAVDWRADVYALGCSLFHVVTGKPPFRRQGDTKNKAYMVVVERHLTDPVPHLADYVPQVDIEFADLCARMMAKRPEDRPSYDAIIRTFEAVQDRLGGRVPAREAAALAAIPPPRRARTVPVGEERKARMPAWLVALTAGAVAVFLLGAVLRLFAWPKPAESPQVGNLADGGAADRSGPEGH